jgi:hypothetical protein
MVHAMRRASSIVSTLAMSASAFVSAHTHKREIARDLLFRERSSAGFQLDRGGASWLLGHGGGGVWNLNLLSAAKNYDAVLFRRYDFEFLSPCVAVLASLIDGAIRGFMSGKNRL